MIEVKDLWGAVARVAYVLTRWTYDKVVGCWWRLNGTSELFLKSRQPENYSFSAHVLDIKWKRCVLFRSFYNISLPEKDQFFLTHRSFVDPTIVLKDNVSLYYIAKDEAAFVVVDEDIDVTQLTVNCFMWDAQTRHAKQLFLMPLASFFKVAEHIGPPRGKLVFVGNTNRCGGTLLLQILQEMEKILCFSEPTGVENVGALYGVLPDDECKKLLKCCINVLCKPHSTRSYEAYVLKPFAVSSRLYPLFIEAFPDVHLIFMYRNCIDNIRSIVQFFLSQPYFRIHLFLHSITRSKKKVPAVFAQSEQYESDEELEHFSTLVLGLCVLYWSKACKAYVDARKQNLPVSAFMYDQLLEDPQGTMKKVLSHISLPLAWADVTFKAMKLDSQRNGYGKVVNPKAVAMTDRDKVFMNKVFTRYGLPTLDMSPMLPGTL